MIKVNEVNAKLLCLGEEAVGGTESREGVSSCTLLWSKKCKTLRVIFPQMFRQGEARLCCRDLHQFPRGRWAEFHGVEERVCAG